MSHPSESPSSESPETVIHTPQPIEPVYRQAFFRWFGYGVGRLMYRQWTQLAAHLFPEGSPQAATVERLGIPLPDRLDFSWIEPTLAVGGRIRPIDIPRLSAAGIKYVVDVRLEHRDDEGVLNRHGIELLYLPTPDTYPLSIEDLRRGAIWINHYRQLGDRVLVHCEHGVGRSVLLAAAALVCGGMTTTQAYTLIADKRWQASPNRRQVAQLIKFEQDGSCAGG